MTAIAYPLTTTTLTPNHGLTLPETDAHTWAAVVQWYHYAGPGIDGLREIPLPPTVMDILPRQRRASAAPSRRHDTRLFDTAARRWISAGGIWMHPTDHAAADRSAVVHAFAVVHICRLSADEVAQLRRAAEQLALAEQDQREMEAETRRAHGTAPGAAPGGWWGAFLRWVPA